MATTWIKPTYAHKRYNNKTTIKRKIDYITDREKITVAVDNAVDEEISTDNADGENAATVATVSGYIQNPAKTANTELVTGYECFPEYADEQFATSMDLYEQNTGRKHKDNSRLLYHMRQAFKPGEVDPRIANRIGYELALEFTGGEHAFIIATHVDKAHYHNHIIFNAFNLECTGKFKAKFFDYRDIRKISDRLCKEYGLSTIDHQHGWADPYNEWEKKKGITKADKEPPKRKRLEDVIALCLEKQPRDFKHLLKYLEDYSCFAKKRGSDISVTTPFSKNPFRLNSLSEEFTIEGIKKQIAEQQNRNIEISESTENTENNKTAIESAGFVKPSAAKANSHRKTKGKNTESIFDGTKTKPELRLIIDLRNSLKATESIGYKKWAEKFNLEQMSQTLLFIEKHQLSLDELQNIATQKPKTLANIKDEISAVDEKLSNISLLQRHIGTYGKTKEIYKQYRQCKTSEQAEQFKQENTKAISGHEAAKAYFDEQGYGFGAGKSKLPSIKELREQYAVHNTEKKILWTKYHDVKNSDKEIDNAWANVKTLLNLKDDITKGNLPAENPKEDIAPKKKERGRNAPNL